MESCPPKALCKTSINTRTTLGHYKTYFNPEDWKNFQLELDVAGILDTKNVNLGDCAKHIEEQISQFPK
jgi:hypothetical protein